MVRIGYIVCMVLGFVNVGMYRKSLTGILGCLNGMMNDTRKTMQGRRGVMTKTSCRSSGIIVPAKSGYSSSLDPEVSPGKSESEKRTSSSL